MATKFNKILVPLDGSQNSMRGLDQAIAIAKPSGAQITGFYVFQLPLTAGIKYTQKMKDAAQDKAVKAIGPAMKKAQQAGAKFQYKTGGGNVGNEIVKCSKRKIQHDCNWCKGNYWRQGEVLRKRIKSRYAQIKRSCFSCKMTSYN